MLDTDSSADGIGLYICICTYVHIYVYMYICTYVHMYIYDVFVCVFVCVCVCKYMYMYMLDTDSSADGGLAASLEEGTEDRGGGAGAFTLQHAALVMSALARAALRYTSISVGLFCAYNRSLLPYGRPL
jgi:hypothetical protein